MELCYYCGKETKKPRRCPHCGLKFCDEHLDPTAHNCIMYEETSSFKHRETDKISETVISEKQAPVETPYRGRRQGNQKTVLALVLIAVSIGSIFIISYLGSEQASLKGLKPAGTGDPELHAFVLGQINTFRWRNDLPDLAYDVNSIAQEYANKVMRAGTLTHNPDLPGNMGENIGTISIGDTDVKIVLAMIVDDMVNKDAAYQNANRDNILYKGFTKVSIGVALNEDTVYLVLNFS